MEMVLKEANGLVTTGSPRSEMVVRKEIKLESDKNFAQIELQVQMLWSWLTGSGKARTGLGRNRRVESSVRFGLLS